MVERDLEERVRELERRVSDFEKQQQPPLPVIIREVHYVPQILPVAPVYPYAYPMWTGGVGPNTTSAPMLHAGTVVSRVTIS